MGKRLGSLGGDLEAKVAFWPKTNTFDKIAVVAVERPNIIAKDSFKSNIDSFKDNICSFKSSTNSFKCYIEYLKGNNASFKHY